MFLMRNPGTAASGRRLSFLFAAIALAICGAFAVTTITAPPADASHHKKAKNNKKAKKRAKKKQTVTVMTRNLYLGADLGPAINATSTDDFIDKNGQILRDVDTNNFPTRAKGLADEILAKSPDLVGLQEVALWRLGPVDLNAPITGNYTASEVHVDYLKTLMDRLNRKKETYKVVKVQQEFDFEAPGDYNGIAGDGTLPGINSNGETNGRLTMRDAIIKKVGAGVKVRSTDSGNFETIYSPVISGIPVNVDRGWTSADVKVRKAPPFRFVNTHLEAFGEPTIREAQAKELVAPGGPAGNSKKRVILVGDLNSDDDTTSGDDPLAYNALKAAGLKDRGTQKPLSCCVKSDILTDDMGDRSDFDHYIDHVMTNQPKKVKKLAASVTGLQPARGYWDSDHAGVFSKLRVKP